MAPRLLLLEVAFAVICYRFWRKTLRFLDRLQPLALLVLRIALGIIMIAHGYPKVFGGLSEHVHLVSNLGLPGWLAYCSAAAEFFGGILLLVGLFTRIAALAILINMSVAIWKVHWKNGLLGNGGYQFPLALAATAFAMIFLGAGPIALDSIRRGGGGGGKAKKA
jgi:putative oxidoreductase